MDKKEITLSVILAVFNEEDNLKLCLASISGIATEIVVVDGGSTDKTMAIAKEYHARIIQTDNPPMFHINKQKALEAATSDWILQLDADEVVMEELREEILRTINKKQGTKSIEQVTTSIKQEINGYYIPRKNYFWGHWMKKTGQYPDYVMRLVRKGSARFPCKSVHEQIEVTGKTDYLSEPLIHNSYKTLDDYWKKADSYTTLSADSMDKEHVSRSLRSRIFYMVVKPMYIFCMLFFRHKGFMDGFYGLLFSYYSSLHPMLSYNKYLAKKK